MYLEKIEIQGFKSFAERTILEFPAPSGSTSSITIIVGPNGSGKSNISDAIKWVLGEQSMKNIRGKKSADMIFSGSEKRSRLGFAEVSLYLNNEDGRAPIDYSEIVITRRLYRDGQNEYLLNKNPIRLFDIQMLLAKSHFGQKSFSIIGQGMIDSVLIATPLERKDFFDEAVGVKEFQIKRHQALNKLIRSEQNLEQANLLVKELSPQLRSLTRQVKRLEKREELQASLREYQQEYYHRIWSGLVKTQGLQKNQISKLQKDLDAHQEELAKKRSTLETMEKQASRGDIFDDLQRKLSGLNQQRNQLLREITILKGRREVDLEKQGKLNLAWLFRQEEEVSQRIIETEKDLNQLNLDHTKIASSRKEKTLQVEDLQNKIAKLQAEIEKQKEEIQQEITKGPLTNVRRRVIEISLVFSKFFKKLKKASAEDLPSLEGLAETVEKELLKLQDHINDEMDVVNKEQNVKVSESNNLWALQQELNTLIEKHEKLKPEMNQQEIQLKVLEEKTHLKQRDLAHLTEELRKITSNLSTQKSIQDGKKPVANLDNEQETLEKELANLDRKIATIQADLNEFNTAEEEKQSKVFKLEREYQEIQTTVNRLQQKQHTIAVELARTETKLEELNKEIEKELNEVTVIHARPDNTETDLADLPTERLFSQIEKIKYQLELIGGIDPETVAEYEQVKERHDFLTEQISDLESALNKLEQVITELDKTIATQFDKSFNKINKEFERYFQILFGGGRAKLIKVMEEEPDKSAPNSAEKTPDETIGEEGEDDSKSRAKKYKRTDLRGIDIYASPAGKKLSTISMLSGGERSLTSLALIAAIISNNPSPFILMDEVDAALDEANSQRMAKVLNDLRQHTQFIIITHNRTVMSIADTIYGVTMGNDGVSKLLSVKLEDVDKHTTRL